MNSADLINSPEIKEFVLLAKLNRFKMKLVFFSIVRGAQFLVMNSIHLPNIRQLSTTEILKFW